MCQSRVRKDRKDINTQTDKGWAWFVLVSAFVEHFFMNGSYISFGIYYKEYLEYFQTSASMISLSLSVQTIVLSVGSFLVMSVGPKFCSTRTFVMFGGLTGCAAYLLNSFAPTVEFLLLSQGVFFGLTHTFVHGPTLVTLGNYFEKKRGLANTLSAMGGSIGGLVMPLLIRTLITYYGLRGFLMVMAGLFLNVCVSGALLRPIYTSRQENSSNDSSKQAARQETEEEKLLTKDYDELHAPELKINEEEKKINVVSQKNSSSFADLSVQYDHTLSEPVARCRTNSSSSHKRFSEEDKTEHSLSVLNEPYHNLSRELIVSTGDITGSGLFSFDTYNRQEVYDTGQLDSKCRAFCVDMLIHIFDKRVIKNRYFLMFLPVAFTAIYTAHFLTLIPPHAADIGLTNEEVSYLFMISGVSDIISKLFLAAIADLRSIKRYQLIAAGLIVFGTATQFINFFTNFKLLAILVVIYATFGQLYFGLFPVMLADFVGIANLSSAIGITILIHGFSMSVANPLLGYIRDTTGSFVGSFHFLGISLIIGGAILLTEPLIRRCERDKENKDEEIEIN